MSVIVIWQSLRTGKRLKAVLRDSELAAYTRRDEVIISLQPVDEICMLSIEAHLCRIWTHLRA